MGSRVAADKNVHAPLLSPKKLLAFRINPATLRTKPSMNSEDMADGIRGRLKPATTQTVHESEAVPIPPRIADYTMLRRIGGGSYGDVWLARSATGQLRA